MTTYYYNPTITDATDQTEPLQSRACGSVHPDGVACMKPVMYQKLCCRDEVYPHDGPHEYVNGKGVITHRWKAVLTVEDMPHNAYAKEN